MASTQRKVENIGCKQLANQNRNRKQTLGDNAQYNDR